ncbi:hypothetical protein HMPREF1008_00227 [Olsenella sp. oral taxon 809 str. F0356]|uniref:DUF47 family protein n=1 Tax=Olsenella sp. oral taxon 809 TaxID=661086 RepID=UPI000231EFB3|nr:hypothetical protein HMPREF1008_00227 [Olsenella sp. oral taxon 809 str. F0356]
MEHTCDACVRAIMVELAQSFITPFDREDIAALAHKMDDIVDSMYGVVQRLTIFHVDEVRPSALDLADIIFHSDRGSQYTSRMLLDWAEENNVRLSCSRTGNCHDNAVAESFFATLKNEMYYRRSFKTRADARRAVFNYIEVFCNRRRPHSTMGYQVPGELMDTFFARAAPGWGKLPIAA